MNKAYPSVLFNKMCGIKIYLNNPQFIFLQKYNDTKLLPHHHPITLIIPSVDARPTALLTLPECA